jgi:uncharacterized protein (DUF1330 family)
MAKVIVQHHVADYDKWYPVFKEHGENRRANGGTGHIVHRAVDDPNTIVVMNEFGTVAGAKAFLADPSLKAAMDRAGVDKAPQIWIVEETESERY